MPLPALPKLPKLSEHLPPNPLKDVMQDFHDSIDSLRQEVESVADAIRITPKPFSQPRNTKPAPKITETTHVITKTPVTETEPGTCLPCESMRQLREAVGKRKVDKALKDLQAKGIEPDNVEILRKYIEGEDVY